MALTDLNTHTLSQRDLYPRNQRALPLLPAPQGPSTLFKIIWQLHKAPPQPGPSHLGTSSSPFPPSLHTSLPALLAVSTETLASALPLTWPQSPCIGCSFQLECSSLHLCHSELKSALPRGLPRWPPSTIVSLCLLAAPSLCLHTSALFFLAA